MHNPITLARESPLPLCFSSGVIYLHVSPGPYRYVYGSGSPRQAKLGLPEKKWLASKFFLKKAHPRRREMPVGAAVTSHY